MNILIAAKADLDGKYKFRFSHRNLEYTLLMHACISGKKEVVNSLIAAKVDLNVKNREGETALMVAVEEGNGICSY